MKFCMKCGAKLPDGAKFCLECGSSVNGTAEDNSAKEMQVRKCPNCGEALRAFEIACPSCGYEIREARSSGAVYELTQRLGEIEAKRVQKANKSEIKSFWNGDYIEQADKEKANLINNFVIPNTKEDIIEFILLVAENIKGTNPNDVLDKAWISKLEQAYRRAEISFKDSPDFAYVKDIYDSKKKEYVHSRSIEWLPFFGIFLLAMMYFSMLHDSKATLVLIGLLVVCATIVACVWGVRNKNNKDK